MSMGSKSPLLDSGGSLGQTGVSVGEDLLRCAMLDIFPMPKTCRTFGLLEEASILEAVRRKVQDGLLDASMLDEMAKSECPREELRGIIGAQS
jgi:hypothetical protein